MPVLDVPLFKQPPDKGECGMACLAMIYAYYQSKISYDNLRAEMELVPTGGSEVGGGLMMPVIGRHLQKNSFKTRLVIANPRLFYGADISSDQKTVRKIIVEHKTKTINAHDLSLLGDFEAYLDSGGEIEVDIPAITHIRREIDGGCPLIALGSTRFMNGLQRKMNFHFTVVTGYDSENILSNDLAPLVEGHMKLPQNWWFHGLIASSYADLDNGSLLCIHPN